MMIFSIMNKTYKTSKARLSDYFEGSRDKWKIRAKDSTYEIKKLKHNLAYNKEKTQEMTSHNKLLKDENLALKQQIIELQSALAKLQKKNK